MLDRFAPLAHLLRMLVEPALNGFENVLMLPSCDPPLLGGGTAMFDGAALADVGQISPQSRPIAFAVLRLITSVNLVGRSIGKSAALAPLRMRSTYIAARLYMSGRLGP